MRPEPCAAVALSVRLGLPLQRLDNDPMARQPLALICLLLASSASADPPLPLEQCQQLRNRVDELEALRRQGGNSAQMNQWQRARRQAQAAFRQGDCRRFRHRLK